VIYHQSEAVKSESRSRCPLAGVLFDLHAVKVVELEMVVGVGFGVPL